jgi:uncharacterized protein YrrD
MIVLRRVRDVIGLPIIELKRGREVGYVHDLLFNEQRQLTGILLRETSFLKQGKYIPVEAVCAIGTDCVTIAGQRAIVSFSSSSFPSGWTGIQTGSTPVQGKAFVTKEGEHLGFVEDVYFHVESGKIVGYELSNGILSDIIDGRAVIRSTECLKMGEDAVIVSTPE